MRKIVVTGGQGFIGSNLIELLLKKKYFVINIDKSSYSANPYNIRNFINNKNYVFFKVDINNKKKIFNIFKKFKPIGCMQINNAEKKPVCLIKLLINNAKIKDVTAKLIIPYV
tara:strand:+ start:395 stop:733 length:339 start_codon:yes stop_codon:yes gene_type:complete